MTQHSLDTAGWAQFPFETQGHTFVSKVAPHSPFMKQIATLPAGMFEVMNKGAIADLIGEGLTREQVLEKIAFINEGASHAVIEIV
jgi:hypothetical protein